MRRGGGKQKGASFERDTCGKLSRWVSHGERDDLFWRSAMSGGRATVARKAGGKLLASQAGDISSVHPDGHVLTEGFYFELKHVKDLALDRFIVTGTGPLAQFWKLAKKEARAYKKKPIIIARQNRLPTLLLCSKLIVTNRWHEPPTTKQPVATIRFGAASLVELWLFDDVLSASFALVNARRMY